jgi:hypothetical protein
LTPIAIGAAIPFQNTGSTNGVIVPQGASTTVFVLPAIGTYLVQFQASITEDGPGSAQLALSINGVIDLTTVVGRATGTDQVIGKSLVTTTAANTTISVINPANNTTALTLTPASGSDTHAFSAHLLIIRIQ